MKKNLLLGLCLLLPGCIFAQETGSEPMVVSELYAWNISQDGKWITGGVDECRIYNFETKELYIYPNCTGTGITNNGVVAGRSSSGPSLFSKGEIIPIKGLSGSISDISASGNRVCGRMNGRNIRGPYCCDIDENGNCGEPVGLPYPELDLFGCKPQFINVLKISEEGKTIGGFIQDWRGMYAYPIIWQEDENGEWNYSLPGEYLFNPNHLEIPPNPWLDEPRYPEATDFMYPESRALFEESLSNAIMGLEEYPNPLEYMTVEQEQAYRDAVDSYNEWYYGREEAIKEYVEIYRTIVSSSVEFTLNDIALNPNGKSFISSGIYFEEDEKGQLRDHYGFFLFDLENRENNYGVPTDNFDMIPMQLLPDNTMVGSMPIRFTPQTYLVLPGSKEFITVNEYLSEKNPPYADWIDANLKEGHAGYGKFSADRSVFIGSMLPDDCFDYDKVAGGYYAFTYAFNIGESGVETLPAPTENEYYKVYNLQGVNVLNTRDYEKVKELPKDIYIINGKKVMTGK